MSRRLALVLCTAIATVAVAPAAAPAAVPRQLYVSVGDSYASGYQPTGVGQGRNTRNGFADQVPAVAARRGYRLKLVNFGCGGATTGSLITTTGCAPQALGPGVAPTRTARSWRRLPATCADTVTGRRS